jgi:hypothetical protein
MAAPGTFTADSLFARISASFDDPLRLRAEVDVLLRALSRAQQWTALRWRLLSHGFPLETLEGVPWYHLGQRLPRLLVVTDVSGPEGEMLLPVPLTRLRYSDAQWLATQGRPGRFYRVGWSYLGFYPVPATTAVMSVTGVCMPVQLTTPTQRLEVPESYADVLVRLTAGLLKLGREREYQEGLAEIQEALSLQPAQTGAAA